MNKNEIDTYIAQTINMIDNINEKLTIKEKKKIANKTYYYYLKKGKEQL